MKRRGRPPLQESPTRNYLLQAATFLFQDKGFKKVSIEMICQRAGVSKMSFYRSFKDKVDLLIAIFTPILDQELSWSEALLASAMPFRMKLDELLKRRKENLFSPFTNLFLEIYPTTNPELRAYEEQWQRRVDALNLRYLEDGQRVGVISQQIKPPIFLLLIKRRNELINDPALIEIIPNFEERFLIVNDFFYFGLKGNCK